MNIALFPGILLYHYLAGLNEMERIIIGGLFALVGILLQQMFTGEVKSAPLQTTQVKAQQYKYKWIQTSECYQGT